MATLTADRLAGHDCTSVENELKSSGVEKIATELAVKSGTDINRARDLSG